MRPNLLLDLFAIFIRIHGEVNAIRNQIAACRSHTHSDAVYLHGSSSGHGESEDGEEEAGVELLPQSHALPSSRSSSASVARNPVWRVDSDVHGDTEDDGGGDGGEDAHRVQDCDQRQQPPGGGKLQSLLHGSGPARLSEPGSDDVNRNVFASLYRFALVGIPG